MKPTVESPKPKSKPKATADFNVVISSKESNGVKAEALNQFKLRLDEEFANIEQEFKDFQEKNEQLRRLIFSNNESVLHSLRSKIDKDEYDKCKTSD